MTWEKSWARSLTHQLNYVIRYDKETNGPWLEFDAACRQLIDVVIPRLLGALQSNGREIRPVLIHGDRWLPFPSPFVPISHTSRFLRHISAISALKIYFAHLVFIHKKRC